MIETALPTTNFAENAGMTVSRVSAVSWCFARNIYRKGEQRKMIENEMTVSVPLEVVKASEIEPKEVKWLWYPYIPVGKVTLLQGDPGDGKSKLMLSIAALLSKGEPLPFTETEENEPISDCPCRLLLGVRVNDKSNLTFGTLRQRNKQHGKIIKIP